MRKTVLAILFVWCILRCFGHEAVPEITVHDPVMIRQGHIYYLFCTGFGITEWSSTDRVNWKKEAPVMPEAPEWAVAAVPGFKNYAWAPDISYYNGLYYLYYAASAFGKNTSCIGLLTNQTLNVSDPAYHWTDRGKIVESNSGIDNWNAIDPNLVLDRDGVPYLAFGSFWSGLKIIRLSRNGFKIDEPIKEMLTIASMAPFSISETQNNITGAPIHAGNNAIEAPFIFKKEGYYYLFASVDYCCRGPQSTYKMIVGRSGNVQGPYLDKSGRSLSEGGGTILLAGDRRWAGVGHNAVCSFDGSDYLIFHGYDLNDQGIAKLRIEALLWKDGWPLVLLNRNQYK